MTIHSTHETLARQVAKPTGPIMDFDVHETLTSWHEVLPYLAEPWRQLVASNAWTPLSFPFAYWTGHGLNRADSHPSSGAPAGSSYELFKEQVLDVFDVKYAVLTGQFLPGDLEAQFEFASALASAYNDWVLEHWVTRDPRILTSLHIAPQDPQGKTTLLNLLLDLRHRQPGASFWMTKN